MKHTLFAVILSFGPIVVAAADESQLNRLMKPTFEELQSEFVFGDVFTYVDLDEAAIERALDAQFHRIEYMRFIEPGEEDCR